MKRAEWLDKKFEFDKWFLKKLILNVELVDKIWETDKTFKKSENYLKSIKRLENWKNAEKIQNEAYETEKCKKICSKKLNYFLTVEEETEKTAESK